MSQQRIRFISYISIVMQVNQAKLLDLLINKNKEILDLKDKNEQLRDMINITIGIAYDKDEQDAISYLVNEVSQYQDLFVNDDEHGKTKRKRSSHDKAR